MGICSSCETKEAKLRRAEADRRAAEDAKRHQEEEVKIMCASLEHDEKQFEKKVADIEEDISAKYIQMRSLLKENKIEAVNALARQILGWKDYLVDIRTNVYFFQKQVIRLNKGQLTSDALKKTDKINKCIAKQLSDAEKLNEGLLKNRDMGNLLDELDRDNEFLKNNDGANDYKVADVIKNA